MTAVQDPTLQRRRLRMELRRARDAAGLKQAEVARAMDWSPSKLIRIERGDVGVSTNDLKALLSHYGVKDKTRINGLLDLARSTRGTSFYDQFGDVLKPGYKEYLAHEASASVIRQYDPVLIPGLLQTEEYGRAVLQAFGRGPDDVDKLWTVRQHRQELHDRDEPPEMLFVVDEAAVRRQVGQGQVMTKQLERLKEHAAADHISLRVLPFSRGEHPGMAGNFILLEFTSPDLDDLVHLESVDAITIRDNPDQIGLYLDRFDQLEELALSVEDSVSLLDEAIREMASSAQPAISAAEEVG